MLFGLHWTHWLVILSVFISIGGSVAYIRDTLSGKTKPNRVSWIVWAIAPILGTIAAVSAGADLWATVRVFLSGFVPLIIFLSSFFNPKSYWKISKFDLGFGALAFTGIFLWITVDSPQLAILFLAAGDGFAAVPTLTKAWKFPETETGITYVASLISVIIILPSIKVWNIENSAFQIYLLIANILLVFFIYRKRLGFVKKSSNFIP